MDEATARRVEVRPATLADAAAVAAIYGHHVLHGVGTFEETPPDSAEMAARMAAVAEAGLPWFVAEAGDHVLGYACVRPYNPRSGYRFCVEDSVFVAAEACSRGLGRQLLSTVIEACTVLGRTQMVAVIGDSGNHASIRLHRALGFQHVGVLKQLGFKNGRWLDVVLMQRALAAPARS
ncbi:GNAT family N-acetyltransferase [Caulobacter sp. S45]|uniref:GNAT family N-acetyltransferase n=1 Tax=Caulobacter sp. S45 TaxID=1641861 RepID=UPI0015768182|nr:GNAT family N-acetyltransferase [Caulobacter sp. S45]